MPGSATATQLHFVDPEADRGPLEARGGYPERPGFLEELAGLPRSVRESFTQEGLGLLSSFTSTRLLLTIPENLFGVQVYGVAAP